MIRSLRLFVLAAAPLMLNGKEVQSALTYGFGEPEVFKMDWSTRALSATDLDNDGLRDLVLINNDAARVELLYQLPEGEDSGSSKKTVNRNRWDPVLEDARFENKSITVGFPMFDLGVGDLNGDGLVDIAYSAREAPLTVRYQAEGGDWIEVREFDGFEALGWTNTLNVSDLDGDGLDELVVVSADAIRIFSQDGEEGLGEPEVLYITGENPFNLVITDATGDGLLDLLYLSTDGKQVLAMREQLPSGAFGPESRHVMERPARIVKPLPDSAKEVGTLTVVDSRSGTLEFISLEESDADRNVPAVLQGAPEIYPIFQKVRESASYAFGDVNRDDEVDLVVANPAEAELLLFSKKDGRYQFSNAFPSFSLISSLSMGRFFEGAEEALIVISEEEKTIGLSRLDGSGRLSFPKQLKVVAGSPICSQAYDMDGDGLDELVLVYENEKGGYQLILAAPSVREDPLSSWDLLFETPIDGVRRKPGALKVVDIFGGTRPGLMLFIPREAPVLYAPDSDNGFDLISVANKSSIRESLLKGVEPAQISIFDVDADQTNELVAALQGFARAFRFSDGQLEMVDQFNARRGKDVVHAVIPMSEGPNLTGVTLYVGEDGEMQFLKRNEDGVFRYEKAIDVGQIDLIDWRVIPGRNEKIEPAYIFAGEDRFWFFSGRDKVRSWIVRQTYETDLEDIHYSHVVGEDFDGDGKLELAVVDGSQHVVDILSHGEEGWSSRMFWQVFEQNMHYRGRTGAKLEPRQIIIEEFTGDGKLDLTLLVHDRILFYPQE
ncbi:MAG: VCBS repeat-containing protein [Verrucomicrobiota bacterium]